MGWGFLIRSVASLHKPVAQGQAPCEGAQCEVSSLEVNAEKYEAKGAIFRPNSWPHSTFFG